MTFSIIAGLMLVIILIVLLYPLARFVKRPILMGEEAILDEQQVSLAIEKNALLRTLSELEVDYAQEKLSVEDYNRIKTTQEHRLLTLLGGPPPGGISDLVGPLGKIEEPMPLTRPWGLMLGMGIWIVAFSVGVSTLVHGKINKAQIASSSGEASPPPSGMPDPVKMVARLESRLKENPNDLNGQMMLGRSYMALDRLEDAKKTWQKVLELDERNPNAHASLGEILLRTHSPGEPGIADEALSHFDKALIISPQDPSLLWGRGVALVQIGRVEEAETAWTEAFRALTPGSQEAEMIKKALEALRSGKIKPS